MTLFKLTDNQILALAIDEWLMGLDDDDWDEAINHIEMRKKQRAQKKAESQRIKSTHSEDQNNSQDFHKIC